MKQKIVWTIGGSDSSGGAGIQNDLKTLQNLGVHGCSVLTAVTAQNEQAIEKIAYLSTSMIQAQLQALQHSAAPAAIKIGMLGKIATVKAVSQYLHHYSGQVVLDPVLASSSGAPLFAADHHDYLTQLKKMLPAVDLFTPNRPEAGILLNRTLTSYQDYEKAAQALLALGAKSVLIKGGHHPQNDLCQDYWTNGQTAFWLVNKRLANRNDRGTGCAFSAAVAACLALNYDIKDALVIAHMYTHRGIRLAAPIENNAALLFHGNWPEEELDLPWVTETPLSALPSSFQACRLGQFGLYPIVNRSTWLKKLLPLGVKMVQLRIKDLQGLALEKEIQTSIHIAKKYQAQLFINDYWELALYYKAYGVHLGQTDLDTADIQKIRLCGLRLGISTHCYYEVARAHAFRPSYLACGPIFPTTSKLMDFPPQGLAALNRWRRTLSYPLVAIGGITAERLPNILKTQVDGIAMISAITAAPDPIATTKNLLAMVNQYDTFSR